MAVACAISLSSHPHAPQINPLRLFNLSLPARSDVVYEVSTGRVWVTAFVSAPQAAAVDGRLVLSVAPDVAVDAAGSPNLAAEGTALLPLDTADAGAWATGIQATVATLLALGGAGYVLTHRPGSFPAALSATAMGLLAFSQLVYFGSRTVPANLPGSFHAVAQGLDWTALSLRWVWFAACVYHCMVDVSTTW